MIITKKLLNEGVSQIKGLKTRLMENQKYIEEIRHLTEEEDEENLKKRLKEIRDTSGTHPYYLDLSRELEDFEE